MNGLPASTVRNLPKSLFVKWGGEEGRKPYDGGIPMEATGTQRLTHKTRTNTIWLSTITVAGVSGHEIQ